MTKLLSKSAGCSALLLILVLLLSLCTSVAGTSVPDTRFPSASTDVRGAADDRPTETDIRRALDTLRSAGVPTESLCRQHSVLHRLCDEKSAAVDDEIEGFSMLDRFVDEARPKLQSQRRVQEEQSEYEEPHDPWFLISHVLGAFSCVCIAALAAGLTMGLLSLDPLLLLIKMRASANLQERKDAAKLLPIVKQHHLLLVTLLLLNSMANEALPLFLEVLVSPVVAVILSVTFVLFFGEIIPSAIFTGPNKIALAAKMAPIVRVVMVLLYPIAFPIAKLLDIYLHDHEGDGGGSSGADLFNRGELSALVRIQYEERMAAKKQRKKEKQELLTAQHVGGLDFPVPNVSTGSVDPAIAAAIRASKRGNERQEGLIASEGAVMASTPVKTETPSADPRSRNGQRENSASTIGTPTTYNSINAAKRHSASIHVDEVTMVEGALAMKTKMAIDIFTPLHRVFAIPMTTKLNERNMVQIYSRGYSRVPVYDIIPGKPKDVHAIRGILMTKQLIVVNPGDCRPVETLPLLVPPCVSPKMNLVDLLNLFQAGKNGHMALVCARPDKATDALYENEAVPDAAGLMGIITIEDVLEALLQEQIYDETDRIEREAARIARWTSRKWKTYVRKRKEARAHGNASATPTVQFDDVVTHVIADEERGEQTPLVPGDSDKKAEDNKVFFGLF